MTGDDRLRAATAVVVNWNSHEFTTRCGAALLDDGLLPERLVLVDNGSSDDSAAVLQDRFPASAHVRIAENIGYARAANRGAAAQHAETYYFVNNDAFVERPGSLGSLARALERERVGIVVPRLLNVDLTLQRSAVPLPTPLATLSLALGVGRVLPNRYRPLWSTRWDHASSRVIRASRGAVVTIRGEVWRLLGGWFEADAMFGEDLDLSWRAVKAGWATWFDHDAVFVHVGNVSGLPDVQRAKLTSAATRKVIERQLSAPRAGIALMNLSLGHFVRAAAFRAAGRHDDAVCSLVSAKAHWPLRRPG